MQYNSNRRRPEKSSQRSQAPLWFVIVGLVIAVYSRGMRDEIIANLLLSFGLAWSAVAMLSWVFYPKHGVQK
jgi:hypothetical protein